MFLHLAKLAPRQEFVIYYRDVLTKGLHMVSSLSNVTSKEFILFICEDTTASIIDPNQIPAEDFKEPKPLLPPAVLSRVSNLAATIGVFV